MKSNLSKSSHDNVSAINFHIWKYCNYKCKFCFATFNDDKSAYKGKAFLSENEMKAIIDEIAQQDITKITFAGGEPLLCKWLPELIQYAKHKGLTTMIVTNGVFLTKEWLERLNGSLDWITLSIDSIIPKHQLKIGRHSKGVFLKSNNYIQLVQLIKANRIRLKLNTVVNAVNKNENLSEFMLQAKPERWKIFQVLPIVGQSDDTLQEMLVTDNEYCSYIKRHEHLNKENITIISENNDLMTGSYLMIDPLGRFYDNVKGRLTYSKPILEIGFNAARKQVTVHNEKFIERGGIYNWNSDEALKS